ncbi:uncharacterized protein BDW47DRAFT_6509 [Aspergillus candidus]|uniref:Uncharacterized protein n=1 Tax=Aspergillus candidus TaxID=41067 RepID=A0A2I2EXY0_ASPCN|nr:hypothetical protein BDW47DRAFT_6509 [Aspergillus candidus]PLB33230.1 hypothetical protein BDW47DRAFT_6509 [Aspergillus candidus]
MARVDVTAETDPAVSGLPRGPIEARSLSSITAIASNPPAYPRNPTQTRLDPLSLYIVRVPGSKDVFLSPLKPPTKASVSAEAINASLYYLHVATPDDDALLQEYAEEREEEARLRKERMGDEDIDLPQKFAQMNQVRRKPVAAEENPPSNADFDPPPPPLPVRPSKASQGLEDFVQPNPLVAPPVHELPPTASGPGLASGREQRPIEDAPHSRNPNPPSRRPLPPVPDEAPLYQPPSMPNRWSALAEMNSNGMEGWKDHYKALTDGHHGHESRNIHARPHSAHESPSHSRMGSPTRNAHQSPVRQPYDHRPPPAVARPRPGFHITLIRRDPTHGIQWNVATMSTPRMDGSAIDIEVSTPGYNRFLAQNEPLDLASLGLNLSNLKAGGQPPPSLQPSQAAEPKESTNPTPDPAKPLKFQRKLCVSRPFLPDDARGSLDMPGNRSSQDTVPVGGRAGSPSRCSIGGQKLKSGYYTFTSPWNGNCTFLTSVNGRTLKCKHMIPMPGQGQGPNGMENPAVTVAEIRFNTPFQAGHLAHQPGSSHLSPFTLSQTPTFNEPVFNPSGTAPAASGPPVSGMPPTTTTTSQASKRSSFAHFLNPHNFSNRPRSRSSTTSHDPTHGPPSQRHKPHFRKSSTSSTDSDGPPPPPLPRRRPAPSPSPGPIAQNPNQGQGQGQGHPIRRFPSEDRLDLSLARENAGGGMRGKSAKLGKLVIEDEGIKMLDLVVAACMAVWWRGYYY